MNKVHHKLKMDRWKFDVACARACMSISDVANETGIRRQTVANAALERGTSPLTLGKIARALGVDPADLLKKEDDAS